MWTPSKASGAVPMHTASMSSRVSSHDSSAIAAGLPATAPWASPGRGARTWSCRRRSRLLFSLLMASSSARQHGDGARWWWARRATTGPGPPRRPPAAAGRPRPAAAAPLPASRARPLASSRSPMPRLPPETFTGRLAVGIQWRPPPPSGRPRRARHRPSASRCWQLLVGVGVVDLGEVDDLPRLADAGLRGRPSGPPSRTYGSVAPVAALQGRGAVAPAGAQDPDRLIGQVPALRLGWPAPSRWRRRRCRPPRARPRGHDSGGADSTSSTVRSAP